jgi:hypothetical protein
MMWANLGWQPAPHWAAILSLALSTCASSGAGDQLSFGWGRRKNKTTATSHLLTYKRYYNLVCGLMWATLGRPPAPHWATTLSLARSTCASSDAGDQLSFGWGHRKIKTTATSHLFTYKRYYNLVCGFLCGQFWDGSLHHTGPHMYLV